ncbi:hypothetical protein PV08_00469 [Exophiala spinifera]|uniref:RWD domain-containing protein n=1 Tax=Exophiala spinifera TaxID=91928 RepID=A0A0D2C8M4_9EURO|nr:uncharacterized protein PV08_00469 [Exophiala spinifera]KIW19894.1 hypothetical protein PV08_00469 [Exophiala spinifera]
MTTSSSSSERLEAELSLLEAMYPDAVTFNPQTLEVTYKARQTPSTTVNTSTSTTTKTATTTTTAGATLTLRLPNAYPDHGVPELITACDNTRTDVREATRRAIAELSLDGGVEVLDQIIATFEEVVVSPSSSPSPSCRLSSEGCGSSRSTEATHVDSSENTNRDHRSDRDNDMDEDDDASGGGGGGGGGVDAGGVGNGDGDDGYRPPPQQFSRVTGPEKHSQSQKQMQSYGERQNLRHRRPPSKTVIIWLHHLLATSKRKLAVSQPHVNSNSNSNSTTKTAKAKAKPTSASPPSVSASTISGMTKPGYPGILLFSGPRDLVDAHVKELKDLNWQAFSKRYDSDEDTDVNNIMSSSNTRIHTMKPTLKTKTKTKEGGGGGGTIVAADDHEHDHENGDEGGEWLFTHGRHKIIEVESMAELARGIVREDHRKIFLYAVGVK